MCFHLHSQLWICFLAVAPSGTHGTKYTLRHCYLRLCAGEHGTRRSKVLALLTCTSTHTHTHIHTGWEKPWVEQIIDRIMKNMLRTTEERTQGVVSLGLHQEGIYYALLSHTYSLIVYGHK